MWEVLISGVIAGGMYAAVALGVVIVRRFARTLNFCHGAIASAAAYAAYALIHHGWPYWLASSVALIVAIALAALLGEVLSTFFEKTGELSRAMATLGPALALIGALGYIWGNQELNLPAPPGLHGGLTLFRGVHVSYLGLTTVGSVILVVLGILGILRFSRLGLEFRALADSRSVASLNGVSVRSLERLIWAFGGLVAGAAALIVTPQTQLDPQFLTNFLITAFTAAVLGGITNLSGLLGGSLIFGVLVSLAEYYLPGQVISIAALVVLLIVLYARPQGLFARGGRAVSGLARSLPDQRRSRGPHRLAIAVPRPNTEWISIEGVIAPRIRALGLVGVVAVIAGVLPLLVSSTLTFVLAGTAAMAVAVAGQNLVSGLSGQLSMAQGGLMLLGGYASGLLTAHHGLPPLVGLVAAAVVSFIGGAALSFGIARLTGVYLAIVTLELDLALTDLAYNWKGLTGGEVGLSIGGLRIPGLELGNSRSVYYAAVIIAGICLAVMTQLARSRPGLRWRAVRDSANGAEAAGIDVRWPRVLAFSASGTAGGVAGALTAYQLGVITPESFGLWTAIYILLAAAVGGEESTTVGAVVGAAFITLIPYALSGSGSLSDIVFGVGALAALVVRETLREPRASELSAPGIRGPRPDRVVSSASEGVTSSVIN